MEMLGKLSQYISADIETAIPLAAYGGLQLATLTFLLTIVLELISFRTVEALLRQRDGKSLYVSAVVINILNHYVFGVPVYVSAVLLFCHKDDSKTNLLWFAWKAFGVIFVHAVLYYYIHKAFHSSPSLYKHHRYHHRFNTYVPPIAANAVSMVEYLVAYVIPFAIAALLMQPTEAELRTAVYIVTVLNLLVHTPCLEEFSAKTYPQWFVSTKKHMDHHRKLTTNYASPTINVDWLVQEMDVLIQKLPTMKRSH